MKRWFGTILLCYCCMTGMIYGQNERSQVWAIDPIPLIFDTDMGNGVDDAVALAVIHALQSRAVSELLAVTITKDHELAAPFTDALNTFYGRGDIPIGVVRDGSTPAIGRYLGLAQERANDGELIFQHDLFSGSDAPEAVELLRRTLAQQRDGSVVVIQVGFSTNLARLLSSVPDKYSELGGRDIVASKVRLLSVMAGMFPSNDGPTSDFNVRNDIAAARQIAAEWPTEIVYSGMEVGVEVPYPVVSIERDYRYAERHLLPEAYRLYDPPPHGIGPDFPMWDVTSVIHAVYPDREYFSLSEPGRVLIDERGLTRFEERADGRHRYLIVTEQQAARFQEAMVQLATQPPD